MVQWRLLVLLLTGTAAGPQAGSTSSTNIRGLPDARSAIDVLQANYYMPNLGSWIGHGAGSGRPDMCTSNPNQTCTCNGFQANWVRANAIEAICNYQVYSGSADFDQVIDKSWPNQRFEVEAAAPYQCNASAAPAMPRGDSGWPYYDDVLWWVLAMLRCSEMYTGRVTVHASEMASDLRTRAGQIFDNVATRAWNESDAACGGGIWWSTHHSYKNAIANELFFVAATKLNRSDWAFREWEWFESSGMINEQSLVNDGLNAQCRNNNATTYTYNQGVILGGLWNYYKMTRNQSLLDQGEAIADAVISQLTDQNGVLEETGCGDGALFKGIFVRYLRYFMDAPLSLAKLELYETFLKQNADSVWHRSQDIEGKFGGWWGGKTIFESATVGLQIAAIDALTAGQRSNKITVQDSCIHGSAVLDRCICRTRYTGEACSKEIAWPKYYSSNRKIVIMTPSGRFVSSGSSVGQVLRPTQSHVGDQEKFTVHECGSGIGLQDSSGYWLTVTNLTGRYELVIAPGQDDCNNPRSNTTYIVTECNGLITLQSALSSNLYLGTAFVGGHEAMVVDITMSNAKNDPCNIERLEQLIHNPTDILLQSSRHRPKVSHFHVSLDQVCQEF